MKFFKKLREVIDPMIGKTVIGFRTSGCMGTIHTFKFIGKIVGISYPIKGSNTMFYSVRILKDPTAERRDGYFVRNEEVPAKDLQNIGGNFYVYYE
jgi:hypothetical protein